MTSESEILNILPVGILETLWGEKWEDIIADIKSDVVTLETTPDRWRDCTISIISMNTDDPQDLRIADVIEIPNNPVKLVYSEPHLYFIGLENASVTQVREATNLLKPTEGYIRDIKAGRPSHPIYDEAAARIKEDEPYELVKEDVQLKHPEISSQSFDEAMRYREIEKT